MLSMASTRNSSANHEQCERGDHGEEDDLGHGREGDFLHIGVGPELVVPGVAELHRESQ